MLETPDAGSPPVTGLVVHGTGGHARDILAIAEAAGAYKVLGCVGACRGNEVSVLPVPWLGDDDWGRDAPPGLRYLIGVVAGPARARVDARLRAVPGWLVHPAAVVCRGVDLGPGTVLWPGSVLMTGVRTGRHVHVGTVASVGHDAWLDDYVTVLAGGTVGDNVRIGCAATIGAGATVVSGVSVGAGAVLGAGVTVVADVAPQAVVTAVAGRPSLGEAAGRRW